MRRVIIPSFEFQLILLTTQKMQLGDSRAFLLLIASTTYILELIDIYLYI